MIARPAVAPHLKALGSERTPADSWAVRRQLYTGLLAELDAFVAVMAGNEGATRFYERLGVLPFMSSYLGRVPET